ncbi:hypothetical protein [Bradyrhizobium sp.]|uniref:hypothetical protein n=1 Tax=Bradyrhizobium sp. TaxID=376 RepID=UPI001EB8B603|nr:hypothetical protein [Bradyrhizobium sp.]MBV9984505.1 hypothetical protein [Bradyrhizobium sp.]
MPINGFTIGRDVAVDIIMPQGPVRFSIVTGWEAQPIQTGIESKGLDGTDRFGTIPSGWQGTVDIDRADANMDIAFDFLETLYYSGQNVPASSITETITEPNGTITVWRFVGVAFQFAEHGSFQGDAKVTQRLSWRASRRIRML